MEYAPQPANPRTTNAVKVPITARRIVPPKPPSAASVSRTYGLVWSQAYPARIAEIMRRISGGGMGVENDPLKAAAIPDSTKARKVSTPRLSGAANSPSPIDGFAGELSLQHRRSEARRLESNRDSGRKNRIEKLAGVAEQRVARPHSDFTLAE